MQNEVDNTGIKGIEEQDLGTVTVNPNEEKTVSAFPQFTDEAKKARGLEDLKKFKKGMKQALPYVGQLGLDLVSGSGIAEFFGQQADIVEGEKRPSYFEAFDRTVDYAKEGKTKEAIVSGIDTALTAIGGVGEGAMAASVLTGKFAPLIAGLGWGVSKLSDKGKLVLKSTKTGKEVLANFKRADTPEGKIKLDIKNVEIPKDDTSDEIKTLEDNIDIPTFRTDVKEQIKGYKAKKIFSDSDGTGYNYRGFQIRSFDDPFNPSKKNFNISEYDADGNVKDAFDASDTFKGAKDRVDELLFYENPNPAEMALMQTDKVSTVKQDVVEVETPKQDADFIETKPVDTDATKQDEGIKAIEQNDPTEVKTDYRMAHQPRSDGARLDDMTGGGEFFPDDIYSPQGLRLYGNPKNIFDRESFDIIQSVKGKPEAEVTIYRAVPDEENITTINEGDFVTLSKNYAEIHGESGYGRSGQDKGKILSKKVKVKDLRSDGNDLNEFGYFPQNKTDEGIKKIDTENKGLGYHKNPYKTSVQFFNDVVDGKAKPLKQYEYIIDVGKSTNEYSPYNNSVINILDSKTKNFANHINTSIPTFKEAQIATIQAASAVLPKNAKILDIGPTEGGFMNTLGKVRKDIQGLGIEPSEKANRVFGIISEPNMKTVKNAFSGFKSEYNQKAFKDDVDADIDITVFDNDTIPDKSLDMVSEKFTFQFIDNERASKIDVISKKLKDDGFAIFEEKFVPNVKNKEYEANEAKKDKFKSNYYKTEDMTKKKEEVLLGMEKNMVDAEDFEEILKGKFKHVVQYWDSGNFSGYIVSNSEEKVKSFLNNMPSLKSEYSNVKPNRVVQGMTTKTEKVEKKALGGFVDRNTYDWVYIDG